MNYRRFAGESEDAYIYRICSKKAEIGTWDDVAKILNEELEYDYTSSKYRKPFQDYNKVYDVREPELVSNEELLEQIREERKALEKEKVKFRDERNAYARQVRTQARQESLVDILMREVKAIDDEQLIITQMPVITENNEEMIVMLSDLHIGVGADNNWNYFDNNVLYKRLGEYISQIEKVSLRHNINKIHFILGGDILSGAIHTTLRIENRENVIKQIMTAGTALSEFFVELNLRINAQMHIYSVAGNHSRLTAKKEDHLKGENLDDLIPFYMQAKLQNYKNIEFHANTIDESIGSFYVMGKLVYFVHGDKDAVASVVQKLTMMTGKKPDMVFMGHRHTNSLTTVYDTKIIECGTLSGTDSYCVDHRLANRPEQIIAICSEDGLECLYDIKF